MSTEPSYNIQYPNISEIALMTTKTDYTLAQLMVTAAAREIADGEIMFVGMRLPLWIGRVHV